MNVVGIIFNRYSRHGGIQNIDKSVTYGPLDWVEVEVPVINAEADDGEARFDHIAILHTPVGNYHWKTQDGEQWHDFVVFPWTANNTPNLPKPTTK